MKQLIESIRATLSQGLEEKKAIDTESIDGSTVADVDASIQEDNTNNKSDDGEGMDKVQPKALKKKFKDRKDKDIDNDGDEDETDKYLHNRRKTISKNIKKGKGEKSDVDMNPKMDKGTKDNSMEQKESAIGETYEVGEVGKTSTGSNQNPAGHSKAATSHTKAAVKHLDQYKATGDSAHKKAADLHKKAADHHAGTSKVHKSTTVDGGVMRDRTRLANKMTSAANAATKTTNESLSIRDKLLAVLSENDREKHYKGAAKPETMDDKLKGKGAKDMGKDHKAKTEKESDFDEKGHDDASKAGKVTKPAAGRSSGDAVRSGDQKIKGTVAAYQKMKGN